MCINRPLKDVDSNELRLELLLRAGPAYQCQAHDCRSMESALGKWDSCPACGRKGYLSGGFVRDCNSAEWMSWEARTAKYYRNKNDTVVVG